MKTQNEKLEYAKKQLATLHKLRDFIWGNFSESDEIYHRLLHLTENAISDKIDDVAILEGFDIKKSDKRKQYVFEVGRNRIGAADVYLNGELMTNFFDKVVKVNPGDVIYTDIVNGMGSPIPDAFFIKALLYSPGDKICHLSDKVKAVLDRDIPNEILEEQKRNLAQFNHDGDQ